MATISTRMLLAAALMLLAPLHPSLAKNPELERSHNILEGRRLQQIALTTRDLPRAVEFYKNVLGLPFLFETNNMAFFDIAGMRLMIALDLKRPKTRPTSILYFDTPNFAATLERLEALDVSFEGPIEIVQSTDTGELKLRQFVDPDGNMLAVMAMVPIAD